MLDNIVERMKYSVPFGSRFSFSLDFCLHTNGKLRRSDYMFASEIQNLCL